VASPTFGRPRRAGHYAAAVREHKRLFSRFNWRRTTAYRKQRAHPAIQSGIGRGAIALFNASISDIIYTNIGSEYRVSVSLSRWDPSSILSPALAKKIAEDPKTLSDIIRPRWENAIDWVIAESKTSHHALSDFNFKIEEVDFKLSVNSFVEAVDPYDAPAPQGALSEDKHETALTFAYAYKFKNAKGDEDVVDLCQNGSIIAQDVSNKGDKYNSVSELKNIIFDSDGLAGANAALPKQGSKININKIYNKIQITLPAATPHTKEGGVAQNHTGGRWLHDHISFFDEIKYLDFMDYALVASGDDPSGEFSNVESVTISIGNPPLHTHAVLTGSIGWNGRPPMDMSPSLNYYTTTGNYKTLMDNRKKRFSYNVLAAGQNNDVLDPDHNRFANKEYNKQFQTGAPLNVVNRTTLLKAADWDLPLVPPADGQEATPPQFTVSNNILSTKFAGHFQAKQPPATKNLLAADEDAGLWYFPYGENLESELPAAKHVLRGTDLSMNPSSLMGIKILKTEIPADFNQPNFGFTDNDIIQTFFIEASLHFKTRDIVFYDSQIIMGKRYYYTLIGVYEVFGSVYKYINARRTGTHKNISIAADTGRVGKPKKLTIWKGDITKGVVFQLDVTPSRRIFEVPLLEKSTTSALINWPPIPPTIEFNPLEQVGNKLKIFFQEGIQGVPILKPFITNTNGKQLDLLEHASDDFYKSLYPNASGPIPGDDVPSDVQQLYYKSQGDLKKITAYRLDRNPTGLTQKEIYEDLLESGIVTEVQFDKQQTGYTDPIKTNIKYYYTFISQDIYGLNSYPSIIYEVEMVEDSGFIYPVMGVLDVDALVKAQQKKKQLKKGFSQYLRIEPSFIQKLVKYIPALESWIIGIGAGAGTPKDPKKRLYTDVGGAGIGASANTLYEYPKIKVRVRSKKTKRAFDLNLKYILNIKEVKDEEELRQLSPSAKVVKKVTK